MHRLILALAAILPQIVAFSLLPGKAIQHESRKTGLSPLFMGRAAAVRAATKSKTDAKKAKTNAVYGKRIIMAVKQVGTILFICNAFLCCLFF